MEMKRYVQMVALGLGLVVAELTGGCGPPSLSPTEQAKADAAIRKEHAGRHQEVNAAQRLQAPDQNKQGASRRAAHRGP
jgi:hypothetical protein